MRRLFLVLLLPAALAQAQTAAVTAAREAPRLIIPGASFTQGNAPLLITPSAPALIPAAPPQLIIPAAPVLQAPAPAIITAARPLTELEAAPEKLPSQAELKKLAESLAPSAKSEAGASDADRARGLDAQFDGKLAPEAAAWNDVSEHFTHGPLAPALPVVETAAKSLIARLLPQLYRRVPARAVYDRGENPATGHSWTPEKGHLIEIAPVRPDSGGNVPSAFGAPRESFVQQKMEHLLEFAHEYFHVLFDSGVGRKENHAPHSAYAAMTEGFAVTGEQLLAEGMLDRVPELGLGPRDAMDLGAIASGRRRWLDVEDNHYSEGIQSWRKAYAEGGVQGVVAFLSSLSASRMIATPRSDPAYQLAVGDHVLLGAYLGHDAASPLRRGLEAYAKAAKGEKLTGEEAREASAAIEKAGPDAWRRVFERTLMADKRIKEPKAETSGNWWEKKSEPMPSVEPAFALARLDPAAGAALSRYLADAISSPGGAMRLFERPGPNEKTNAIIAAAETLPWAPADHALWNDRLMRWLLGTN
jgi:hypothetical protein